MDDYKFSILAPTMVAPNRLVAVLDSLNFQSRIENFEYPYLNLQ